MCNAEINDPPSRFCMNQVLFQADIWLESVRRSRICQKPCGERGKMALSQESPGVCWLTLFVCVCVCVCVRTLSHVRFFATPGTVVRQASLSMEFSRREYQSGLPFPLGYLPDPRVEPHLFCLLDRHADSLAPAPSGKPIFLCVLLIY